MFKMLVLAVFLSVSGIVRGQVFYEPVQYQYHSTDGSSFYYGGSNPRVFERASRDACISGCGIREGRFGMGYLHCGLIGAPPRVYSDRVGTLNAAIYGLTPNDARNEAYANAPRYFRMSDLLASAVPAGDGMGMVVPAQAPRGPQSIIEIRPYRRAAPSTQPATAPRPVLILPRSILEPPAAMRSVAAAR